MITLRTLVCAGLCASLFSACQNDKRLPGSPVEYFGSVMPITGTEVLDLVLLHKIKKLPKPR